MNATAPLSSGGADPPLASVTERGPLSLIERINCDPLKKACVRLSTAFGALVSAAAGADTAVARASIAVAAEPVRRPRFEWVVPLRLLGLRLLDQMLVTVYPMVGVLSRISRHRGRRYNAKRQRQDQRLHFLLLVFLLSVVAFVANCRRHDPRAAQATQTPSPVNRVEGRPLCTIHQAGTIADRFFGICAMRLGSI